ncbi:hypothetical protein BJY24_007898 [Nocardia transvalensis]|uniref:Uncharacterized protein n=1 Tax=Nocardia transvalensis TaxID=37333 RepID=A0A7W9PMM6_9NOCA|nr:hypothetical protein [Nocardia transvalensis]MBB5918965.1 hypothetical protein [Nocardia transvalensis]
MAFTVQTAEDPTAVIEFSDNDRFTIRASGVLEVESRNYGTRIYAPGFWQLVNCGNHSELLRKVES